MAWVDDHRLPGRACAPPRTLVALRDLLALAAALGLAHRVQHGQRGLADDTVRLQAGVALELLHSVVDRFVEDAALRPGIEPQQVELDLESEHVIAAEGRHAQVQEAISERVAGLDQLPPGVGPHDPVDEQAAALLEGLKGRRGAPAEEAVETLVAELEAQRKEPLLDVGDLFAAVAK